MPFIQRIVEPICLSRQSLHKEEGGNFITEYELEAVTNNTLSSALRQLASLVVIANDIFDDLAKQLQDVSDRATKLRTRIDLVEEKVSAFDPKTVTVPEGDLCGRAGPEPALPPYSSRRDFPAGALFSAATRPAAVRRLYECAARTPVPQLRQLDRHRADGRRASRIFLCTPVLGRRQRQRGVDANIDIETRTPAAVAALRRWTSAEALGDVTAPPDCSVRLTSDAAASEADHRLPSPEEQLATVALRFPGHMVAVDVSGRAFQRMSQVRRSQQLGAGREVAPVGGRARRPRHKRRNTLAGTDRREIRQALAREAEREAAEAASDGTAGVGAGLRLAASSDLLSARPSTSASSTPEGDASSGSKMSSHLRSLKQWAGKAKLRLTRRDTAPTSVPTPTASAAPAPPPMPASAPSACLAPPDHTANVYETAGSHLPITASSGPLSVAVKMREKRDQAPPLHSSSGNWSASSESGRASLGSSTSTSHQPRSTTTVSSATGAGHTLNTSASSSGTLTPDLAASIADQDSSSVYSCDTEGYYTSFHMDSGLKTLREEEPAVATPGGTLLPPQALHSTCALSAGGSPGRTLTADSEYELFGKGSTSTTTSSAGTVCTTLQLSEGSPAVPERKSSLLVAAEVHADSPDSGHNTSSSPAQSASPPGTLTVRSRSRSSDCDFSESDLEAVERVERIRVKTAINSSRIPSMCVITPPQSDDDAASGTGAGPSEPASPATQPRASGTVAMPRRPAYDRQLSSDSESDWTAIVRKDRRPHLHLNGVIGKVKDALTGKKSPDAQPVPTTVADAGDYVTIADVRPRQRYQPGSPRLYSNVGHPGTAPAATEYVSLDELPPPETTRAGAPLAASPPPSGTTADSSLERKRRQGARVTLDSEGRVVYSSDSLRRRGKTGHSTFEPGPYVKEAAPASPQLGKVVIRPAPALAQRPLSPPPAQRPGAYVNVQSPTRSAPPLGGRDAEEGQNPTYGTKAPPSYICPPQPVDSNAHVSPSTAPYWTLPTRRSQEKLEMESPRIQNFSAQQNLGQGRFNTIATSGYRTNVAHRELGNSERKTATVQNYLHLNNYESSPTTAHHIDNYVAQQFLSTHNRTAATAYRNPTCPLPASVPKVPTAATMHNYNHRPIYQQKQNQNLRQSFLSSTPTKDGTISMDMSTNFSPISKQIDSRNNRNILNKDISKAPEQKHKQNNRVDSPRLVSPPKTSMTSEEIFAAIHRSKKRLNIKTDFDSYSRSASPSCSSVTSLSPGSSESSICGVQGRPYNKYTPETGTFTRNENNRSRHSWSPNATEEQILNHSLELKSPVQIPGSRQSWACDRPVPLRQTSRNDFKKLLLQQSSKSNISSMVGCPGNKISAVEQLKLSRQKAASATIDSNSCYSPRSPAEKRNGGPKLLSSPRSLGMWKFSSPRTDVLSSTIPEDCAEDEEVSSSPQNSPSRQQQSKSPGNVRNSQGRTLINPSVRRPLSDMFGTEKGTQPPRMETSSKTAAPTIYDRVNYKQNLLGQFPYSVNTKSPTINNKFAAGTSKFSNVRSPEVLTRVNVKENLNTNQINHVITYPSTQGRSGNINYTQADFKSPHLIRQQQSSFNTNIANRYNNDKVKTNYYNGSAGHYILGTFESKSPSPTLETAL